MKSGKMFVSIAGMIIKISLVALVVVGLYKLLLFSYDIGYKIFAAEALDREPGISRSVAIADGKSVKEIGEILEDKGLVEYGWLFPVQEMFSDYHGDLKPGVYELSTAMTPYQMMEIMASGEQQETQSALEALTSKEEDMEFTEEPEGEESIEDSEEDSPKADEVSE